MKPGNEAASATVELYRSDRLVVRQVATADRDRWVVTFDNYGIGHGFDRPGFGEDWLRATGVSAIHVLGKAEDWYQYEDIEAALATVRAAVDGAGRVITYGSSMGGYAAIRFADAVGAHAAVALSPQYTLNPAVAGHDRRWSQDVSRIAWLPALNGPLVSRARIFAVYDPCGPDDWHGRRIAQDVDAVVIRLPYTVHPVTTFLSEIGLLSEIVIGALDGDLDGPAFRLKARSRRGASGVYLGELAIQQPLWRPKLALALARRAVAASASGTHAALSLAKLLSREGLHDEALETLDVIVRNSNRSVGYLVDHGLALALAGRTEEAQGLVREVLDKGNDAAHLYGWASSISWIAGDLRQARRLIATAIRLDPDNPAHRETEAFYRKRMSIWTRLGRWVERRREEAYRARPRWARILIRRVSELRPARAG